MVDLNLGKYLLSNEVGASGKTAVVLNEGQCVTKRYQDKDKEVFELQLNVEGLGERVWTANKTAQRSLAKAWGNNTKQWVGQRIKLSCVKVNVSGEVKDSIYAEPVAAAVESVK